MAFSSKSPTIKRIMQESRELSHNPDPTLTAAPLESNLFEWHFTITGPPSSPYAAGIYHGRIVLPASYPLRPPSFRFLTPSGRFETNREICLSISGHHEESWQPAWGIRTALCAIRAFMTGDAKGQVGGLDMHPEARERLARESRGWRCAGCGGRTNEEIIKECEEKWRASDGGKEGLERKEEVIPEELRLTFREDLEGGKGVARSNKEGNKDEKALADEKASQSAGVTGGLVQDVKSQGQATTTTTTTALGSDTAANVAQQRTPFTPRNPTTVSAMGTATANTGSVRQRNDRQELSGPPRWVDKAIAGVALALLLMFIKRVVGMMDY